jgi:hypothetical protein
MSAIRVSIWAQRWGGVLVLGQGVVEGDVVAVGVRTDDELVGLEQAPLQLFGGVGEMAGQVGAGR